MSYQLITIVGNVGKDAEMRYTKEGIAVASFSVATERVTGKGDTKNKVTTWFKVTVWREKAETASKFVKKGMKILVSGEVSTSAYIDKSGEAKASLEVTANDMKFLTFPDDGQGGKRGQEAPKQGYSGMGDLPVEEGYKDEVPF